MVGAVVDPVAGGLALALLGALLLVLTPELLGLANLLLRPVQKTDNARFERRARRKLRGIDPLVIGITGSYGKTTTKGCVAQVADLLGPTLPTPASFNSYLGVIRTINENLRPSHRNFVVEMGAYRRGDIAELCRLVEPRIGILTAIGPAHLERFGSLDETARAKGELGEALPGDGAFITRADDERCREAPTRTPARSGSLPPSRIPMPSSGPRTCICAWPHTLRLCLREAGRPRDAVRARLLGSTTSPIWSPPRRSGRSWACGRPDRPGAGQVSPPKHGSRRSSTGPPGSSSSTTPTTPIPPARRPPSRCSRPPGQRRMLVTPGMVEFGDREEAENERFGEAAAGVCD